MVERKAKPAATPRKLSVCDTPVRKDATELLALLADARGTDQRAADAPVKIYELLLGELKELKRNGLYPQWEANESGTAMYNRVEPTWDKLIQNTKAAAEHLWREEFAQDASNEASRERLRGKRRGPWRSRPPAGESDKMLQQQRSLERLISYARALKLLELEANLYYSRMDANFLILRVTTSEDVPPDHHEPTGTPLASAREALDNYWRAMLRWDTELRPVAGKHLFRPRHGDIERIKALSKEFRPESVSSEEVGWLTQGSGVSRELRYRYFDALLWVNIWSKNWFGSMALMAYKMATGYGRRPLRFVGSGVVFILVCAGLYFVSDLHADRTCSAYHVPETTPGILLSFLQHIYVSITTLVTLGASPTPCGPGSQVIITVEAIMGYFLLAALATVLIDQLLEADR